MADLVNEFSWSKTRSEKFETCLRQYYLHYYASWGGWKWDIDPATREIYIMKNLSSIPIWIGSSVHKNVEWLVKNLSVGRVIPLEDAIFTLRSRMENDWKISNSGQFRERPNKLLGLLEHYYHEPINIEDFETAYTAAEKCIRNLYQRSVFTNLLKNKDIKILQIEKLDSINVEGIKVWVVADLVLDWNRWLYIVDWKTGKNFGGDGIDLQLAIYALYGSQNWNRPPENIYVHQSNLRLGQYERKEMTSEDTLKAVEKIKESATRMQALMVNMPNNLARESDFPKNEDTYHCRFCNFRKACDRI